MDIDGYFPLNPSEKLAYDELWAAASPDDGSLGGLKAVTFLQVTRL